MELIAFLLLWYGVGLVGSIFILYFHWNNGEDIDTSLLVMMLILSIGGFVVAVIGVIALLVLLSMNIRNIIIIRGRNKI